MDNIEHTVVKLLKKNEMELQISFTLTYLEEYSWQIVR